MTIAEIVALAGQALAMYQALKGAAQAQGMTPATFDAAVEAEARRLAGWKAKTDAAEDAVFASTKP